MRWREERYRHASNDPEVGGGQTLQAGHHLPKLETRKLQKIIITLCMEGTDDGVLQHRYMRHTTSFLGTDIEVSRAELKNKILGT